MYLILMTTLFYEALILDGEIQNVQILGLLNHPVTAFVLIWTGKVEVLYIRAHMGKYYTVHKQLMLKVGWIFSTFVSSLSKSNEPSSSPVMHHFSYFYALFIAKNYRIDVYYVNK